MWKAGPSSLHALTKPLAAVTPHTAEELFEEELEEEVEGEEELEQKEEQEDLEFEFEEGAVESIIPQK